MNKFKPFENDTQSLTIGTGNGITFENGQDKIVVYGDTTIDKNIDPIVIDNLIQVLLEIKQELIPKKEQKLKK